MIPLIVIHQWANNGSRASSHQGRRDTNGARQNVGGIVKGGIGGAVGISEGAGIEFPLQFRDGFTAEHLLLHFIAHKRGVTDSSIDRVQGRRIGGGRKDITAAYVINNGADHINSTICRRLKHSGMIIGTM